MISQERTVLARICDEVATPVAYKASLLLRDGNYEALASMKVDPRKYSSAVHYLRDAQVVAFLKKHPGLPLDPKRAKEKAIRTFYEAERDCYIANERLNPLTFDLGHYGVGVERVFRAWRKEIKRVLRNAPQDLQGRFGPGSTYANKGELITIPDKLDDNYTTTLRAANAVSHHWDRTAWSRYAAAGLCPFGAPSGISQDGVAVNQPENDDFAVRDFSVVLGNRFTTVDKTALTKRGICIEPSLNLFYQLALGRAIEERLGFSYGWKKKTIQEYHGLLARLGSLTGQNATIDLSNASDTVCERLVRLLLPPDWFNFLANLRSPYTRVNGKWVRLEKFSSMGNGYTFELETLIFYTLCRALKGLTGLGTDVGFGCDVSCFGDDIIVPRELAPEVISVLEFCGFSVNKDKTFLDGPFRESCGWDFYRGHNVRPHFQKVSLDEPHKLIACVNGLMRYRDRLDDCGGFNDHHAYVPWLINRLPRQIRRCRGPASLGDLVITDESESNWDTVMRSSIRYIRVWRPVTNAALSLESFRPGVVMALALYGARERPVNRLAHLSEAPLELSRVVPRIKGSYVSGYRFGRVAFS